MVAFNFKNLSAAALILAVIAAILDPVLGHKDNVFFTTLATADLVLAAGFIDFKDKRPGEKISALILAWVFIMLGSFFFMALRGLGMLITERFF